MSHNQNPVLKWSTQNHASRIKQADIRSYLRLGLSLTNLHPRVLTVAQMGMATRGTQVLSPCLPLRGSILGVYVSPTEFLSNRMRDWEIGPEPKAAEPSGCLV